MFEHKAKDLKRGDEFTIDHGETWHVIADIMWGTSGLTFYCTDTDEITLTFDELVIVK